jgi:transposase-like protein
MEAKKQTLVSRILSEKCPNCGKTHVYKDNGNRFTHVPHMKERCEACNYKFEREPGYFIGAMYLSYGLAVLQGIIAFLLANVLIAGISDASLILITCSTIILFAFPNFRLSRIIWMHIFPQ